MTRETAEHIYNQVNEHDNVEDCKIIYNSGLSDNEFKHTALRFKTIYDLLDALLIVKGLSIEDFSYHSLDTKLDGSVILT